jgi:hypothetical protein
MMAAKRVDRPRKTMVCPTKRDKELGAPALRVAQRHIEIAAALLPRQVQLSSDGGATWADAGLRLTELAEALGKIAGWLEEGKMAATGEGD